MSVSGSRSVVCGGNSVSVASWFSALTDESNFDILLSLATHPFDYTVLKLF